MATPLPECPFARPAGARWEKEVGYSRACRRGPFICISGVACMHGWMALCACMEGGVGEGGGAAASDAGIPALRCLRGSPPANTLASQPTSHPRQPQPPLPPLPTHTYTHNPSLPTHAGTSAVEQGSGNVLHKGDPYSQTRTALEIVAHALEALGSSLQDVVRGGDRAGARADIGPHG